MRRRVGPLLMVLGLGAVLGVTGFALFGDEFGAEEGATPTTVSEPVPDPTTTSTTSSTTTTTVPLATTTSTTVVAGEPWGSVPGLTMFRGNPTRTYYGGGPLPPPGSPEVAWRYPDTPMCGFSSVGGEAKQWCGMGWTGQPVVYERADGKTELIFGAYDKAVHFVDGATGEDLRPKFVTGDIIKGSVTLDPDGYPLLYFGSRDNLLRIVALDRDTPELLWSLNANAVNGIWNNDWDGNPVVVDDIMYVGGENGWFFAYQLNRRSGADSLVSVDPEQLVAIPGYNDDLIAKSGRNVSIESSVAVFEDRVYFTNSGGRVVGLDVSDVRGGNAPIVFDYYAGGDIDATPIVDTDGFLYVSIEHEPSQMGSVELAHNREVGQLVKLDPYTDGDPRMWGIDLTDGGNDAGIWATPALYGGVLYVNTHNGDLIAVDAETGEIVWSDEVGWHSWSSPSVVDDILVVATCLGELRGYDLANPRSPTRTWTVQVSASCLEATPAIWDGTIYIGSRDGHLYAFR